MKSAHRSTTARISCTFHEKSSDQNMRVPLHLPQKVVTKSEKVHHNDRQESFACEAFKSGISRHECAANSIKNGHRPDDSSTLDQTQCLTSTVRTPSVVTLFGEKAPSNAFLELPPGAPALPRSPTRRRTPSAPPCGLGLEVEASQLPSTLSS